MSGFTTAGAFLAGTMLLTMRGEAAVETLRPGDELVTIRRDGPPSRPVLRVARLRAGQACGAGLIRILAGAFAPSMPARDLVLFGDTAIYADGALFELRDLCNGSSIMPDVSEPRAAHAVELAGHDVVLAEGLPVEASAEAAGMAPAQFGPNVIVLHPAWAPPARAACCLPVSRQGEALRDLRRMLDYRAGVKRRVLAG